FLPAAVAQVPPSSLSSPHFTTVQSSRTKSDALTAAPLPADTVLTTVFSVGSVSLGSEISGFWPNFPSTWATPSAESLFLSSSAPHAAVNSRAGTASSAARRRYVLWFISPTGSRGRGGDARHSTTCDPVDHENAVTPRRKNAPGTHDAPGCHHPGASRPAGAAGRTGHMPAISFSTRSSTERKGSLHSTVRCAWSFSLRWTQSTVKSRRCSWARRMKSPRSRARVVCGGTDLPSKILRSLQIRAACPLFSSR